MQVLKAADHKRMAWKNGGGQTIEIAVHPPGAGLADFDWRVSAATIAVDGPFSCFEGIDRTLAILSGGMELTIEGGPSVRLSAASDPLRFPADVAAAARLTDGAVADLNVMTRRAAFDHRVRRLGGPAGAAVVAGGRWSLVVAAGPALVRIDGEPLRLEALDGVLLTSRATISRLDDPASPAVFVMEIRDASHSVRA